ncbi:MAG: FAD-dependent pyridine nucleotide-disulfide oxidoreductase [Thermoleophilia bacterium]|nr:FAD-dependent pyridine nucleotide-disulfide oxidoreductase [Thermoleophilia bacterium]
MQHVVVIGGGFAGQRVVKALRGSEDVRVTLVDRTNHHCFQPLLYQVATGSLSPGEIAPPHRWVVRKQRNVSVVLAEVDRIDVEARTVEAVTITGDRTVLTYDHLVVAAGARHGYFGNDQWEAVAPGLKTIEDAIELRYRLFGAFERADVAVDDATRRRRLTFVVVGAGPTGVELAGQFIEVAHQTLRREYRRFDPSEAHVVLVDAAPRVLPMFDEKLSKRAQESLERMGVEVRLGAAVTGIDSRGIDLGDDRIEAGTVVWAAGVQGSPLGRQLAEATGAEVDRGGRVTVDERFALPDHPDVYVIGDLASAGLPGVAPAAMQTGTWVGREIAARVRGTSAKPFRYKDKGSMATIGRHRAVAQMGRLRFSGTLAWFAWLFVHLMYVVGFANRVLVTTRWAFSYVGRGRGERVLTRGSRGRGATAAPTTQARARAVEEQWPVGVAHLDHTPITPEPPA